MSPAWPELYVLLPDLGARAGISHFLRFCTSTNVGPDEVDDAVSTKYLAALEEFSLKSAPRAAHQKVCRGWNRAVIAIPAWPRRLLAVPRYREPYVLSDDRFPCSSIEEIGLRCARLSGKDPVAEDLPPRPVKASKAERRGFNFGS